MKHKKTLFLGALGLLSLAAYLFLFTVQAAPESTEAVDALTESVRYVGEPALSPDVQLLKGILKAITNLLPAS